VQRGRKPAGSQSYDTATVAALGAGSGEPKGKE
jgi:hypothetical protein